MSEFKIKKTGEYNKIRKFKRKNKIIYIIFFGLAAFNVLLFFVGLFILGNLAENNNGAIDEIALTIIISWIVTVILICISLVFWCDNLFNWEDLQQYDEVTKNRLILEYLHKKEIEKENKKIKKYQKNQFKWLI